MSLRAGKIVAKKFQLPDWTYWDSKTKATPKFLRFEKSICKLQVYHFWNIFFSINLVGDIKILILVYTLKIQMSEIWKNYLVRIRTFLVQPIKCDIDFLKVCLQAIYLVFLLHRLSNRGISVICCYNLCQTGKSNAHNWRNFQYFLRTVARNILLVLSGKNS